MKAGRPSPKIMTFKLLLMPISAHVALHRRQEIATNTSVSKTKGAIWPDVTYKATLASWQYSVGPTVPPTIPIGTKIVATRRPSHKVKNMTSTIRLRLYMARRRRKKRYALKPMVIGHHACTALSNTVQFPVGAP